jgi:U3 small nucleolar RNA-associated protein 13
LRLANRAPIGWGIKYQLVEYVSLELLFYLFQSVLTLRLVTPTASHLVICSRSLSMRIFALNRSEDPNLSIQPELLRTLKPHTSPVVSSAIDSTGTLLATGSADGTIKVWDIRGGYVTHTFHGHGGVVGARYFFFVLAQ